MYDFPCGIYNRNYSLEIAIVRTKERWLLLGIMGILFFFIPYFVAEHNLVVINTIAIWIVAAFGLNLLTGYCGEISLGHAAFMGVGAYSSTILADYYDFPFLLALPSASLIAGMSGIAFAAIACASRIKGFYLAIVTLAAQVIFTLVVYNWISFTGGKEGLDVISPTIGGLVIDTERSWFYLNLTMVFLMGMAAKNMARSNVGRAFVAIRDNDLAAEVMGINLFKYKTIAFFVSSLYAGAAGSLWAHYAHHITGEFFNLQESIWFLGMIIVGGMGKTMGPVFGVIFILLLKQIINNLVPVFNNLFPVFSGAFVSALGLIIFGLVVALFLIFEPRGIAHMWDKFKNYYRTWPFSY